MMMYVSLSCLIFGLFITVYFPVSRSKVPTIFWELLLLTQPHTRLTVTSRCPKVGEISLPMLNRFADGVLAMQFTADFKLGQ